MSAPAGTPLPPETVEKPKEERKMKYDLYEAKDLAKPFGFILMEGVPKDDRGPLRLFVAADYISFHHRSVAAFNTAHDARAWLSGYTAAKTERGK